MFNKLVETKGMNILHKYFLQVCLPHRRLLAIEHVAEVRYKSFSIGSYGASLCDEMRYMGLPLRASWQGSTGRNSGG